VSIVPLTDLAASLAPLWVPFAQVPADTVVALQQQATWRTVFDVLVGIAHILIALAMLAIAGALAAIALILKKKIGELIDTAKEGVEPVMKHARDVADNVNYISTSVRVDVQNINQTVHRINERVNHVVDLAEERIHEINALVKVAQDEVENLFVESASVVRGVQTSRQVMKHRPPPPPTTIEPRTEL
jgi:uncharacterized protein YoxC